MTDTLDMYVWYYGGFVRITVIHRDFAETTDTFTMISNIDLIS
jgi:hypothetical protein